MYTYEKEKHKLSVQEKFVNHIYEDEIFNQEMVINIDKNKMSIKGYTTSVSPEKTIMEIEKILSDFGADTIMKEYSGDGTPRQLSFKLQGHGYQLPANIDKVKERLIELKKTPQSKVDEQSVRVAWRVLKDWLYSQMTIIYIGQAEVEQVLLPYMSNGKKTMYQMFKEGTIQIEDMR